MGIRKHLLALSFLFLIGIMGFSKSISYQDTLVTNTVLYRVTHAESGHVSYLFGTHHAFGKPFFDSLQFAGEAIRSSSILIKENLNLPGHLAEDIINKRSSTTKWKRYLDTRNEAFIRELFSTSNLVFDKMTPAELYAFLSRYYKEQVCIGKDPDAAYFSLDDYIGTIAEEHQLEVVGLETSEEQVFLINEDVRRMPRKVHKRRIEHMIHRLRTESMDHCAEIDWYRNMDFDFRFDQPCQNALVLTDRNKKWMVQLQEYLSSENCFVAVGLSHLMFECGLIKQLTELGYQIVPVEVR